DFIRRLESGEHLLAGGGASTELIHVAAVDVRIRLARMFVERLAPVLGADRHVQRTGQSDVVRTREIEVRGVLLVAERAGVEGRLIRRDARSEGRVDRVADVEIELVAPVAGAEVVE